MLLREIFLDIGCNGIVKGSNDISYIFYDSVNAHHRRCAFAMMLNWITYGLKFDAKLAKMAGEPFLSQDKEGIDPISARQFGCSEIESNRNIGEARQFKRAEIPS